MAESAVDAVAKKRFQADKFNGAEVKAMLDDALKIAMPFSGFIENHRLTDTKLTLGYLAAFVSAAVAWISNKMDFNNCRSQVLMGVVAYTPSVWIFYINRHSYFILYGMYLFHGYFIEKNIVYVGVNKEKKLTIKTTMRPFDAHYTVTLDLCHSGTGKPLGRKTVTVSKLVSEWVTEQGELVDSVFVGDLNAAIKQVQD